jgi:DNA-binding NtrC family response regulator
MAVNCIKKGAFDYLIKPVSRENLLLSINRAMERKRFREILDLSKGKKFWKLKNPETFKNIVTQSSKMLRILKEVELHSLSDIPILITGETGTGKELLSQAIHAASPRAKFKLTAINMESLNQQLFEAQFFGYTKGAFTGAETGNIGYLENGNRGTIFLDEIGNLPIDLQGKLLRVLQELEFIKIGSCKAQKVNVRFVAATNADLEYKVKKGTFRKDLYYRLKGGWVHLPPLRKRRDDIPLLINHFVREICGTDRINIEEEVLETLRTYDYPGNIRELKSILRSAMNLSNSKTIAFHHLPKEMLIKDKSAGDRQDSEEKKILTLKQKEKNYILKVYNEFGKNKSRTARALNIARNTLKSKLDSNNENYF